jgi:hypothetical protein
VLDAKGKKLFSYPKHLDRLLGPPNTHFKGYGGFFPPGVKRPEYKSDHSPKSSAAGKYEKGCTFAAPFVHSWHRQARIYLPLLWVVFQSCIASHIFTSSDAFVVPDALIGLLFNLNTYKFNGRLFSTIISIRPRFCEYFLELIRRIFSTCSFFLNSRLFGINDISSYTIDRKILASLCSFKRIPLI